MRLNAGTDAALNTRASVARWQCLHHGLIVGKPVSIDLFGVRPLNIVGAMSRHTRVIMRINDQISTTLVSRDVHAMCKL